MAPSATTSKKTASQQQELRIEGSSRKHDHDSATAAGQDGRDVPPYLEALSKSQYAAATHPPTSCLQILAGPGSGKTRVLTSRVAWLILDPANKLKPEDILVVTFTNKAANEMKMRLVKLIGKERVDNLVIGTFHSVCARYLRKYGKLISLPNNFTIIDSDDAKRMFKAILKDLKADLDKEHISIKPEQAMSEISKAKAKEIDPIRYRDLAEQDRAKGESRKAPIGRQFTGSAPFKMIMATIYTMYQQQLVDANALDFDDLLVYGVQLFRRQNQVVRNIQHVLVDEFQDTNITQYELMRLVATASQAVSIVGDPDQSIYGWRSAEIGNLDKMTKEFNGTKQARLEENYRSTGAILELALKVVQQDTSRVDKDLYTSHPRGLPVVLKSHGSAQLEASYIASEVKRLVAHSGGMLDFNDFVILLRFNYLSRAIEAELQARGIDSRMMGGHKFFDRMEVKDLLAYLALADNPGFTPAFIRVVNVPKRGIGEKGITDLLNMAKAEGCKPMKLVEKVVSGGKNPGIKPAMKKGLKDLVEAVGAVREAARTGTPVAQLLETLIEKINYENYLKAQPDYEARWGNVQELISFSTIVAQNVAYADANAPSVPLEQILSHTLSNQEGTDTGRSLRDDSDDEDDSFEEVDIKPSRSEELPTSPDTHPYFKKHGTGKRKLKLPAKGEIIDLCDSSEESQESAQVRETQASPAKKRRTAKKEPPAAEEEEASADDDDKPKSALLSQLDEIEEKVDTRSQDDADEADDEEQEEKTPLRVFLEASILATDMDAETDQKDEKKKPKVTISTCHAAKGLEWPVVFIPAIEQGCFPSFRCERPDEVAEERRLLYVAMTRAESVLYLTHASARMQGGDTQDKIISNFVASVASKTDGGTCDAKKAIKFCTTRPEVDYRAVKTMAEVTGKDLPTEAKVKAAVAEWDKTSGKEVKQVDQMNSGRMTGFGTYASYGGAGGYTTAGVHSGATGGWNSQMGFGLYSDDGLRSSSAGRQSQSQSGDDVRRTLGFTPPTLGSFSSAVDDEASPGPAYSGFQRASSLGGVGRGGGFGAFVNRNSKFPAHSGSSGAGGRHKQPLIPPSRQPAATPSAPPSFTDAVRLRARPEDSLDCDQPSSSFKIRGIGAICQTAISQHGTSHTHLVSSSGGNAGLAVAYAASRAGVGCTIFVPLSTEEDVIEKLRADGAVVVVGGDSWDQADAAARSEVETREGNAVYVHPFEGDQLVEGHSGVIDEVAEQMEGSGEMDVLISSVGGGGLLRGIMKGVQRQGKEGQVTLVAVQNFGVDSFNRSLDKYISSKQGDLPDKVVELSAIESKCTSMGTKKCSLTTLHDAIRYRQRDGEMTTLTVTDPLSASACWQFSKLAEDGRRRMVELSCASALTPVFHPWILKRVIEGSDRLRRKVEEEGKMLNVVVEVCGGSKVNEALLTEYEREAGSMERGDRVRVNGVDHPASSN
ncbi:potential DNA repair helicase [Pseudozyma hubeiensis SY62]|uniref:Potential DNA repair helicase n=1 Tax=Pseudozyma hubeiensis (strain SY62) TaxID=1305764 RepID=R9P4J7_PSEHS|nr:potential DNA repair helicase [Pseudozyma hubeiensis SY62]GAC96276.1 potential DNA repair helicase [Pseudozyma hubeiensis SY62]